MPCGVRILLLEITVVSCVSLFVMFRNLTPERCGHAAIWFGAFVTYLLVRAGHVKRWITGIDKKNPLDRFARLMARNSRRIQQARDESEWPSN